MVQSLIVMNARGSSLHGQTLVLAGVSPDLDCIRRPAVRRTSADRRAARGMDHRRLRQSAPECDRICTDQGWPLGPWRCGRAAHPPSL